MLDLRFIRAPLARVRETCERRPVRIDLDRLVELDETRRQLIADQQQVREQRNQLAAEMKGRKPSDDERSRGKELKDSDNRLEDELKQFAEQIEALQTLIPNMTHPDVPVGATDEENAELRVNGEPARFEFEPLDHLELGEKHDLIDFESAARVTGQKWYYLKNELVLVEQALIRYALELLRARGFTLFQTPDLARTEIADGLGFNPRGEETNINSIENEDLVLVGTAEITLGGLHRGEILDAEKLPLYYCGLSHCFRTEAGAAGRASKGLYRVHQFTKGEMFSVCQPDESEKIHEEFVQIEEEIFEGLEIPFRVVDVCTGDLGGPAYRKYDLEAWMPGRGDEGSWGEITSTSNCTDYQARRLGIRYRDPSTKKPRFVHMLNGTAISCARALVALMEIHQQADGSIRIPDKLTPFTGFDRIG